MVLLHAFARVRDDIASVATFDHGTGPAAARAAAHVTVEAMRLGLPVVAGRGSGAGDEASWRAERWAFLAGWAAEHRARVVTAHTRDDQAETVFMRILRGSGVRGLAGMYARSPVARPLLAIARASIVRYAGDHAIRWVEDPSNERVTYLRNRVRLELLPACERVNPGFTEWLLDLSRRAAAVRETVARAVDALIPGSAAPAGGLSMAAAGGLSMAAAAVPTAAATAVPAASLAGLPPAALALLWPEIAARAGVTLDRRAVARLVLETPRVKPGAVIPLAGRATISRTISSFVVRNSGSRGMGIY